MNKYKNLQRKAQKVRKRERMCTNKATYETYELAYQKGQTIYQCRFCKKFHRSGKLETFINTLIK